MPNDIEDAGFEFYLRNEADADSITITGRVVKTPIFDDNDEQVGVECHGRIEWNNTSYRNILFDYDVAPYIALPRSTG